MYSIQKIIPNYFVPKSDSEVWDKMLAFEKGQTTRIIAPSGSGKSSLIHFMGGMSHDYSGKVSFKGLEFGPNKKQELSDLRSKEISLVFQDLRLINSLSLIENLQLKTSLSGIEEDEVLDLIHFFELSEYRDKKVLELSQGEKQRVCIIRSLCQNFDFILLDEPFSHLDQAWQEKAWEIISRRQKKLGAGLILTSLDGSEKWHFDSELRL